VRSSIRSAKNPLGQADPELIHEVAHGLNTSAFEELREGEEAVESLGVADAIADTALGRSRRLRFSHTGKLTRNEKGYPLNPTGRTGLDGRGEHLLWGPNHRAAPVIVRCSAGDGAQHVQLLMTKDFVGESGKAEWSLPEDAVPAGHCISPQLLQALEEQALSRVDLFDDMSQSEIRAKFQSVFKPGLAAPDSVLHAGVWDPPGNTDRAWTEALCVLVLLEEQLAACLDNGCQQASWVPYDPSMPIKAAHLPLISEAVQRLSRRGVCDAHGNVSSGFGGFSLSASMAGLEQSLSSVFAVQSFTESSIEEEQRDYEELEKSDGLYAEATVAARRQLAVRYDSRTIHAPLKSLIFAKNLSICRHCLVSSPSTFSPAHSVAAGTARRVMRAQPGRWTRSTGPTLLVAQTRFRQATAAWVVAAAAAAGKTPQALLPH